jgi:hypothetical protein
MRERPSINDSGKMCDDEMWDMMEMQMQMRIEEADEGWYRWVHEGLLERKSCWISKRSEDSSSPALRFWRICVINMDCMMAVLMTR